jgi:hypothetical protein
MFIVCREAHLIYMTPSSTPPAPPLLNLKPTIVLNKFRNFGAGRGFEQVSQGYLNLKNPAHFIGQSRQ